MQQTVPKGQSFFTLVGRSPYEEGIGFLIVYAYVHGHIELGLVNTVYYREVQPHHVLILQIIAGLQVSGNSNCREET